MMWQDWLFFLGSIGLGAALWPSIRSDQKPAAWTSFYMAAILGAFIVAFASLHLWLTVVGETICTIGWAVLWVQKVWPSRLDAYGRKS